MNKITSYWLATTIVCLSGIASADNVNLVGVDAFSGSSSAAQASGVGNPYAGASASGGNPMAGAGVDFDYSPSSVSNYQAQKFRTFGGPAMPQLLQAAPNRFISNGKGMAQLAQPVASFLQESCDTALSASVDSIETIEDSYGTTDVVFAPYFDFLNGHISDSDERPMVSVSYNFFKDMKKLPTQTLHLCVGVITVKSTVKDLVSTQTLKLDAINFVRDHFGATGPVLLVAEQSGLTSFEGVKSDGFAWGAGLNSAGNAGAPIIGASASISGNDTDVDPTYQTGQTFYVLIEVKGENQFGHAIVADVLTLAAENERQIIMQLAQAERDRNMAAEAAVTGGNGIKATGSR